MFKRPRATFALILAAGFAATPAFAEPPWRRGNEQRDGGYERGGRGDVSVSIVIGEPSGFAKVAFETSVLPRRSAVTDCVGCVSGNSNER